jgi:hypothetical protein
MISENRFERINARRARQGPPMALHAPPEDIAAATAFWLAPTRTI